MAKIDSFRAKGSPKVNFTFESDKVTSQKVPVTVLGIDAISTSSSIFKHSS